MKVLVLRNPGRDALESGCPKCKEGETVDVTEKVAQVMFSHGVSAPDALEKAKEAAEAESSEATPLKGVPHKSDIKTKHE